MSDALANALHILTRRKTTCAPGDGGQTLQRSLSVVDITCLGLSTTLGAGVFVVLAFSARESAGPSVVLSFLIAAVASCLGGLCYSELASRFPVGGPAYSYVYATMGELPAFLVGWAMVLEYLLGGALAAKALTQYLNVMTNQTIGSAFRVETTLFERVPGFESFLDFPSALFILLVGLLLVKDLKLSCLVNNVLVFICFLVIGGIVLISMCDMDVENWTTGPGFFPNGVAGIFAGASTCFFSFHGYDIIGSSAGECAHRIRIVPVGISLAFLLGLVACFTSSVSITLLVPSSLLDHTAPLLRAFDIRNLRGMQYFVMLGASTGLTASLLVSLAALSRLFFFMANDGLLPPVFTSYRQTKGTTPAATFLATLLTSVIAVSVQSTTLLMWMGMGSLLAYTSVALSVLSLRYGLVERLPFESEEIFSRDSTCSDLRACNSSVHPVVTRSVSDCYLNKSLNECTGCDFFADSRQRPSAEEMAVNPNYIASSHKAPSRGNALRMSQGNQDYGSLTTRTMAVEFVNHSYVTSISSYAFPNPKRLPTPATARRVTGLLGAMMTAMLGMGLFTTHVPRLFPHGSEWWLELVATLIFFLVCVLVALIVKQPQQLATSRNSIPCVPLLPICAIWMDVHLAVCLGYTSWLTFLVWGLIGVFVYMSYGVWQSVEGAPLLAEPTSTGCDEMCFGLSESREEDRQEMVHALADESDGSSV